MSAAAVAAGAVAVESANVVGVTTVNATQGKFYMIGAQFEDVGGGEISIQDFVTGDFVGVDFDENYGYMQTAPKLQVWTPSGYIGCYYLNDAYDLDKDDGTTYEGWADESGNYVTDTVSAGMAAWFMDSNEACTLNVKGQVLGTDGTIQTTANKFFMVANPYPVETAINSADIDWDGIVGVDFDENYGYLQTAPKLQIWTPAGYIPCYYLNDAYDLDKDDGTTYEGWADESGNYVTDNFPVGYAAWFYAGTDVDITFAAP
ncbi:MAG: hypothetical protein ILM98_05590 [Kiritimatiellae bacterium]|nr:hypothetical protein [Kiritimatiellia bacterium]